MIFRCVLDLVAMFLPGHAEQLYGEGRAHLARGAARREGEALDSGRAKGGVQRR